MLLIDGVKYQEWTPTSEDEFERIFANHASELFGEDSRYFDLKHKLSSKSGTGSIPDGYVITFGDKPRVHIVELELASHSLQHIVSQVVNIVSGIENPATQQKICNRIEDEINQDDILTIKITKSIKPIAIHRFLSDCFSDTPTINVIIDKSSPALEEALHRINYPNKIIEFQTLTREGASLPVHAHLFEPIQVIQPPPPTLPAPPPQKGGKKVTFAELVKAGLLHDGQVFYFYNTRPFKDERAHAITSENKFRYVADGKLYSKTNLAEQLFKKYGFEYVAIRGPKHWKTEDGRFLVDLEEQVRIKRGSRK